MTKLVGLLFIANSIIVAGWWVTRDYPNKGWVFTVSLLAVFAGMFLFLQDRATEVTIEGVGTIKAAVEKASEDAQAISALRQRIEAQSATVDLVAQQATTAKGMAEQLAQKSEAAEKKLVEVDSALTTARSKVDELQQVTEFTRTVLAAQNDDRKAFDLLEKWANDPAFRFRSEAGAAWTAVLDEHAKSFYMSGFTVPWKQGIDPAKLTLADLRSQFSEAPTYLKPALIEYVWERKDIAQGQRMAFLADVVAKDGSLNAVEYAGRFLSDALDAKLKPLAVRALLQAWDQKKGSIK